MDSRRDFSVGQTHAGRARKHQLVRFRCVREAKRMTDFMRQDASARFASATGNLHQMRLVLNEYCVWCRCDAVTRKRTDKIDMEPARIAVDCRSNEGEVR